MTKTTGVKKNKSKKWSETSARHDTVSAVAAYYGFTASEARVVDRDTLGHLKKMLDIDPKKDSEIMQQFDSSINLDEKLSILYNVIKKDTNLSHPLTVFYSRKNADKARCGLEVIGSEKSIVEATLIKTAIEILKEDGYENTFVEINSVGDKESLARLTRELTAYYRKHINELPPPCRQLLKRDVFEVLLYPHEKCILLREDAPQPISYLTELSREHFREVLEYIERMEIPYQIISSLVGNRKYAGHVVFEIKAGEVGDEKADILARGIRYNGVAKKIGSRKDIPAAGVVLLYKSLQKNRKATVLVKKPKVYFIQLGYEAKLKSLKVIEMLRQKKITVQQSLSKDKLSSQLATAEHLKIPYILIMGQKEAMENSIIVRNMTTRSQEIVGIEKLSDYLKKVK